ncbi:MAG TPA: PKD domain-containing protein, partial [Solirubrobacter sp.]
MTRWTILLALLAAQFGVPATAVAAPGWLPAFEVEGPVRGAPQVAFAPGGALHAIWLRNLDGAWDVRAAQRPPGGGFAPAVTISRGSAEMTQPSLAVSKQGSEVAVWAQRDAVGMWVVRAAVREDGHWGAPQPLSGQADTAPKPVVAMADDGEAIVIFNRLVVNRVQIQSVRRPPGGSWGSAETISGFDYNAREQDLVMDGAGNATALWMEGSSTTSLVDTRIVWAQRPAGGVWTAPVVLASQADSGPAASWPDLAIAGSHIAGAWTRYGAQRSDVAVRPALGAWGPAQPATGVGYGADQPQVAIDAAGNVTVAISGGQTIATNRLVAGGTWPAQSQALSGNFSDAYLIALGAGPRGRVLAAWLGTTLGDHNVIGHVEAATRGPDGWGATQDFASGGLYDMAVAVDDADNGVVVWSDTDGPLSVRAYDASGPDLVALDVPAAATTGAPAAFSVDARDRWSPGGRVTWDYGDGVTETGSGVSHAYVAAGRYTVAVTATDGLGNATTEQRTIVVTDAPAPAPVATLVPAATVTPPAPTPAQPTPKAPAAKRITIPFRGAYKIPGSRSACRGKVTLTLKLRKTTLARKTVELDRRCRFGASFTVARSKLGNAKSLSIVAHFHGNKVLGATT